MTRMKLKFSVKWFLELYRANAWLVKESGGKPTKEKNSTAPTHSSIHSKTRVHIRRGSNREGGSQQHRHMLKWKTFKIEKSLL